MKSQTDMTPEATKSLGELLRGHRLDAKLTQEELGVRAGLSARTISDLERGIHKTPFLYTINAISGALDLSPEETSELENVIIRARTGRQRFGNFEPPDQTIPWPLLPIFGRDDELEHCMKLLLQENVRLLTLTGIGGVGKSRLMYELGHRLRLGTNRNVTRVQVVDVPSDSVLAKIASNLDIPYDDASQLTERIVANLSDHPHVLILDNLALAPGLALQLMNILTRCPALQIIVTSRDVLGLPGEHVFLVRPFPVEDLPRYQSLGEIAALAAVQAFVGVARARATGFMLTEENATDVLNIVSWLDGLPGAIDLAAAQTAVLTPREILSGLRQSAVSTGSHRSGAQGIHLTILDAIEWSYAQLSPPAQRLLRLSSVFAAGWTLEHLSVLDGIDSPDHTDLLDTLVTRGLIKRRVGPDGRSHFRLLRFVQEFGLAELRRKNELEEAKDRYADWIVEKVEASPMDLQLHTSHQPEPPLDDYEEDIKTSLEWLLASGQAAKGVALLWHVRYWAAMPRPWLERWLGSARTYMDSDRATRAIASALRAAITTRRGYFAAAKGLIAKSLAELRAAGLDEDAVLLTRLVAPAPVLEPDAWIEIDRDIERLAATGPAGELGHLLFSRAAFRLRLGDYVGCQQDSLDAVKLDQWLTSHSDPRIPLAATLILQQELLEARAVLDFAIGALPETIPAPGPFMLAMMGVVSQRLADAPRAAGEYGRAVWAGWMNGTIHPVGLCLSGAAWLASLQDEWRDAALLLAAAGRPELPRNLRLAIDIENELSPAIRQHLSESGYVSVSRTGQSLPLGQVIGLAVKYLDVEPWHGMELWPLTSSPPGEAEDFPPPAEVMSNRPRSTVSAK